MTADPAYLGPDLDLIDRIDKAYQAPIMAELTDEQTVQLRERLIAAGTFLALTDADRELLERACAQVDAGLSPTWQDVGVVGSDWAAEDAAVEVADAAKEAKALAADGWIGV